MIEIETKEIEITELITTIQQIADKLDGDLSPAKKVAVIKTLKHTNSRLGKCLKELQALRYEQLLEGTY